jgi:hypothetical protein
MAIISTSLAKRGEKQQQPNNRTMIFSQKSRGRSQQKAIILLVPLVLL